MESSNFNGADGMAVKARCKLGKIFNSTSEENTVSLWNGGIPHKLFPIFESKLGLVQTKSQSRQFIKVLPYGLDWQAYLDGTS